MINIGIMKLKMTIALKLALGLLAFLVLGFLLFLFLMQRALIYPGAYNNKIDLSKNNLLRLEKIELSAPDDTPIMLYRLGMDRENPKALLLFHGNADTAVNIINRLYNPYVLYHGYDIYAMEYRGFDGSSATPSEDGILMDSKVVLEYLKSLERYGTIVYYGHSLGTAVAINLAKEAVPSALVLEAPFSSLAETAHHYYPLLPVPLIKLLLHDRYDSMQQLQELEIPNVMILHARDDQVVPFEQGASLFAQISSPNKIFADYDMGGHSDIFFINDYKRLRDFLLSVE